MKKRSNEAEVRRMVGEGYMANQIAAELRISADAVRQMAARHKMPLVKGTSSFWSDARKELVRKAVVDQISALACAKKIGHGCTRNMCLSLARRMGLTFVGKITDADKAARSRKGNAVRVAHRAAASAGIAPKRAKESSTFAEAPAVKVRVFNNRTLPLARPHPVIDPEPSGGGVPLTSMGTGHCRWPFGVPGAPDFGFCGADKVRGSYCGPHAARAYVTARPAPERQTHGRPRRAA